jgi:hypothetical protein
MRVCKCCAMRCGAMLLELVSRPFFYTRMRHSGVDEPIDDPYRNKGKRVPMLPSIHRIGAKETIRTCYNNRYCTTSDSESVLEQHTSWARTQ